MNAKRVQRIWRREGRKVPQKQPKRGRLWLNDGSCVRLRASRPITSGLMTSSRPVEGWEAHVLRGGLQTLRRFTPTLYMEVSADWLARAGDEPADLWQIVHPLGYIAHKLELIDGEPLLTLADTYLGPGDYLFIVSNEKQQVAQPMDVTSTGLTLP